MIRGGARSSVAWCGALALSCGGLIDGTPPPPDAGAVDAGGEEVSAVGDSGGDAIAVDAPSLPCSGASTVSFAPKEVLTFAAIGFPQQMALGDVNGDGHLDVVMREDSYPQNQETTLVFLQDGKGNFPSVSFSAPSIGVSGWAVADVTSDGLADVVEDVDGAVLVHAGNAKGMLDPPKTYALGLLVGGPLVIGDFDGDGANDVVVQSTPCSGCTTTLYLLLQKSGALASPLSTDTTSKTWGVGGDVNGDGLLDIVGVQPGQTSSPLVIIPGASGGAFGAAYVVPFEGQTLSQGHVVVGDVTGDGKDDVVVTPGDYPSKVLVSVQKNGSLSSPASYASGESANALALGDVNGDCLTDVVVQHVTWFNVGVYLQIPGGTLASEVSLPSVSGADVIAVGDLDGDGKPEIVTADQQSLVIFRNTH